jgi:hypothetical protein
MFPPDRSFGAFDGTFFWKKQRIFGTCGWKLDPGGIILYNSVIGTDNLPSE